MDFLEHHGILGMKWGIRRFQNKDGSLTDSGRKRYLNDDGSLTEKGQRAFVKNGQSTKRGKQYLESVKREHVNEDGTLTEKGKAVYKQIYGESADKRGLLVDMTTDDFIDKQMSNLGISSNNVLKKGSVMNRISNEETLDSTRKYVSILPFDNEEYGASYEFLPLDLSKNIYSYGYKANKDLKIASAQEVMEYAISKYGDKRIESLYNDYKYSRGKDEVNRLVEKDWSKQWMSEHTETVKKELSDFATKVMSDASSYRDGMSSNELMDYFSKKGYDAMIDIEDAMSYIYPIIVFNPKDSMSVSRKTIYGGG